MLLDFCAALDAREIGYVILSGYLDYPDRIDSDIDFMVSETDFPHLPELLGDPVAIPGASLIQAIRHETSANCYVLARQAGSRVAYLTPDSAANYRCEGRLWLFAESVLSSRRMAPQGFWIPSAAVEFEYYLIKRIGKGLLESTHLQRLAALMSEDPQGCETALRRLCPVGEEREALREAILAGNTTWLTERRDRLRKILTNTRAQEGVFQRVLAKGAEWLRLLNRILRPTGLVIAVLGPDGSGKTTIIEHLERELAPAFRRVHRFHLRPHFGLARENAPVANPHSSPSRGRLASTVKIALFLADYWLGWLRLVFPAKVRSGLVIFDRYYHDMLADPVRYRLPNGFSLPRAMACLVPRPDICLVLHAPPEKLVARKGEVSLVAARMLAIAYTQLANRLDAHLVDTDAELEKTLAEALRIPLDHLARRTRARLGLEK